jgi:hypothetical protein
LAKPEWQLVVGGDQERDAFFADITIFVSFLLPRATHGEWTVD